jgi:hypothetical protein
MLPVSQSLQLIDGLSWGELASIIMWADSSNKSPLIYSYITCWLCLSGEPWLICYSILKNIPRMHSYTEGLLSSGSYVWYGYRKGDWYHSSHLFVIPGIEPLTEFSVSLNVTFYHPWTNFTNLFSCLGDLSSLIFMYSSWRCVKNYSLVKYLHHSAKAMKTGPEKKKTHNIIFILMFLRVLGFSHRFYIILIR